MDPITYTVGIALLLGTVAVAAWFPEKKKEQTVLERRARKMWEAEQATFFNRNMSH